MSEEEVRKALEECADDAAVDARDDPQPTAVEPAIPIVNTFEKTVDPLADRLSERFRAWRASRSRRER